MATVKHVEYICSYCGKRVTRLSSLPKPLPGVCTAKGKNRSGLSRPHSWIIYRKY